MSKVGVQEVADCWMWLPAKGCDWLQDARTTH